VLEDLVQPGHTGIGRAVLDVHRHVAVLDEDPLDPAALEYELPRAQIGRGGDVVAGRGKHGQYVVLQASFGYGDSHFRSQLSALRCQVVVARFGGSTRLSAGAEP
jgi:hypothetical protein